jgi:uncharacterized Tic20 family protein
MEQTPTLTTHERDWAMCAHLAGLLALTHIPFANIVGPLIVYLKVRDESPYATAHARAALNFQITFAIFLVLMIVVFIFGWVAMVGTLAVTAHSSSDAGPVIGAIGGLFVFVLILLAAGITNLVCCIMGGIAASSGRPFHYPVSIPFVK